MNKQKHKGQLSDIIIGTVVREGPVGGDKVADILLAEGRKTTKGSVQTRLNELAKRGRIEKVRRGVYEGV